MLYIIVDSIGYDLVEVRIHDNDFYVFVMDTRPSDVQAFYEKTSHLTSLTVYNPDDSINKVYDLIHNSGFGFEW